MNTMKEKIQDLFQRKQEVILVFDNLPETPSFSVLKAKSPSAKLIPKVINTDGACVLAKPATHFVLVGDWPLLKASLVEQGLKPWGKGAKQLAEAKKEAEEKAAAEAAEAAALKEAAANSGDAE